MAMIKGKQIKSINAAKIVETEEKRFVSDIQIASFVGKAELSDVQDAKTEASDALSLAKVGISEEIATAKTQAVTAANAHTDEEVLKLDTTVKEVGTKLDALEIKVVDVENSATTGLENRYTKSEIDGKLATLGAGIKYKGTVASYAEIAIRFPEPEEGWLVASETDRKFYVYDAQSETWEVFPIEIEPCTTHTKTIRLVVSDSQKEIATGIKTDGDGSLQTAERLIEDIILSVNGVAQTKTTDYTVAVVESEVKITWKSLDFELEASDVITLTYNQIV